MIFVVVFLSLVVGFSLGYRRGLTRGMNVATAITLGGIAIAAVELEEVEVLKRLLANVNTIPAARLKAASEVILEGMDQ